MSQRETFVRSMEVLIMPLPLFLIVIAAFAIAIFKCMKNEDQLIELEDKIIEDIRDFLNKTKKSKKISVVQTHAPKSYSSSKVRNDTAA